MVAGRTYLFVAMGHCNSVLALDTSSRTVAAHVSIPGRFPHGLYHDRDRQRLYVANERSQKPAGMGLGIIFAAAGWLLGTVIGPAWNGLIGLILVVMGLRLLRILRFRGIALQTERRQVTTLSTAFFFGAPFVFAL